MTFNEVYEMKMINYLNYRLPDGFYDLDPMTEYEEAHWKKENCDEYVTKCPDVF